MDLRSQIGRRSEAYTEAVTSEWLDAFRRAVGLEAGESASPTFMTVCRQGEFQLFKDLGIELSSVLHVEQQYRYGEPVRSGDAICYTTELSSAAEKHGASGTMSFLTFETKFEGTRGSSVFAAGSAKSTIVVRKAAR